MKTFFILSLFFSLSLCSCQVSKTYIVSAETRPCTGVVPKDCLLIKTNKNDAEWQNFYSQIEGFTYEKGYEYQLLVKETKIAHPPADASSVRYTLIKLLSKQKKENRLSTPHSTLNNLIYKLISFNLFHL